MHMFELFEFELGLNSMEKIKRKAFGNSRKIGKPNSVHLAQSSPTRPRVRLLRLTGGTRLSTSATPARSPSLSLCRWGQLVDTDSFARAPAPSRYPVGPPYQRGLPIREFVLAGPRTPPVSHLPFPNLPPVHPAVDAPMSCVFRLLPHTFDLLLSPHPLTHSPRSVALLCRPPRTPLSHSVHTCGAPPSSAVTLGPFRGRRRAPVVSVAR
jgi:hypothetical protein